MVFRAYYYSFIETGNDSIDKILEAVAKAGKGAHHTDGWKKTDDSGKSPIDKIQAAADLAAKENVTLQKQLEVADNYFKRIDGSRLDWFSTSCIAKEALAKIKELGGGL